MGEGCEVARRSCSTLAGMASAAEGGGPGPMQDGGLEVELLPHRGHVRFICVEGTWCVAHAISDEIVECPGDTSHKPLDIDYDDDGFGFLSRGDVDNIEVYALESLFNTLVFVGPGGKFMIDVGLDGAEEFAFLEDLMCKFRLM